MNIEGTRQLINVFFITLVYYQLVYVLYQCALLSKFRFTQSW